MPSDIIGPLSPGTHTVIALYANAFFPNANTYGVAVSPPYLGSSQRAIGQPGDNGWAFSFVSEIAGVSVTGILTVPNIATPPPSAAFAQYFSLYVITNTVSAGLSYYYTAHFLIDDGGSPVVPGCTNPAALNYNPAATVDDGSCILPVRGCTDPTATNYNPAANVDDGSCVYPGGGTGGGGGGGTGGDGGGGGGGGTGGGGGNGGGGSTLPTPIPGNGWSAASAPDDCNWNSAQDPACNWTTQRVPGCN